MKYLTWTTLFTFLCFCSSMRLKADEPGFPLQAKRILFLGDSITNAGHYISMIEEELRLQGLPVPEMINLGLPSETCSGLSEPDHPFPRPDVHERIDRALSKVKPDLVVACYGMNDGIYYPFSADRFEKYQAGIREIIKKVKASGAKLILMTPPAFDALPLKKQGKLLPSGAEKYAWFSIYEGYDDVMKKYAAWIMTLNDEVEMVIDLHTPVNEYVAEKRRDVAEFTMSPDGVHVNVEGHSVLAKAILKAWGIPESKITDEQLSKLVQQRQLVLHNAWLSHVGHLRPGVKPGLPLAEANALATDLEQEIQERLIRVRPLLNQNAGKIQHLFFPASTGMGELSLSADYYLWIPPGVKHLRGVIVHQHGCGDGASKGGATAANELHWRELAKKWDCALLGSSYEGRAGSDCRAWCDPRRGSADRFVQAINTFANTTGHPEIADIPWCLWGHSGGGFWASIMQALYPEKIVAIWLQSGQAYSRWSTGEIEPLEVPPAAYKVPVVACPGLKEKGDQRFHVAWDGCLAMFQEYRQHNAPIIFAPDPLTGHECGDSRYLAIPFFDVCLQLRLPEVNGKSNQLKELNMKEGFLADIEGHSIQAANEFQGNVADAVWLPTQEFADVWLEFIKKGSVSDQTPPPAPTDLVVQKNEQNEIVLQWKATADFESGLAGFKLLQGEKTLAELPMNPTRRFGRPLFQKMSYHDTPEQPLPAMSLRISAKDLGPEPLKLISINSVGLTSDPATAELP